MMHEVEMFCLGVAAGAVLSAFFDWMRALRRNITHPSWAVTLEDFVFWLTVTGTLFFLFEAFNKGVLRFYVFLGCGAGAGAYICIFTKIVFPVFFVFFKIVKWILIRVCKFFAKCKKIVKKMMILPLKNILEKIKIVRNNI